MFKCKNKPGTNVYFHEILLDSKPKIKENLRKTSKFLNTFKVMYGLFRKFGIFKGF